MQKTANIERWVTKVLRMTIRRHRFPINVHHLRHTIILQSKHWETSG